MTNEIIIIVAFSKNMIIGKDGKMPWHISEDLKHFKKLTDGHTVIMGRKTWESLPIKPLPNRENIILTRNKNLKIENAKIFGSLNKALEYSKGKKAFIIGGATIYEQALPFATKLEITLIDKEYDGDTKFPEIDYSKWKKEKTESHEGFAFITYSKKTGDAL